MDWSAQQQRALDDVRRWIDDPQADQVYRLFGYAGTGKSTLLAELNEHVGGRALACAYTGKAASVMARKGLPGASTVHHLIYTPAGNDDAHLRELEEELKTLLKVTEPSRGLSMRIDAVRGALLAAKAAASRPRFLLKAADETPVTSAPVVFCDEVSMVDEAMGVDLLSFGTKLLVVGDPAQLPPVKGTGFFTQVRPDTLLTEVHRQAQDNPIISLATTVREGRALPLGDFGAANVVTRIGAERALAADQILCGTNAKRRGINARHRNLGGHGDHPMPRAGERLVCLRNNRDLGVLNGTIWDAVEHVEYEPGDDVVSLRVTPEGGGFELGVPAEAGIFLDEETKSQWPTAEQFTWGYCLTVHKSQGSQWDDVVLFDDWPSNSSHKYWLYTGITRAAERLTVVRT